ncbi:hypothetical protein B0H17DRAFT_1141324, partial [Mycena rosella]
MESCPFRDWDREWDDGIEPEGKPELPADADADGAAGRTQEEGKEVGYRALRGASASSRLRLVSRRRELAWRSSFGVGGDIVIDGHSLPANVLEIVALCRRSSLRVDCRFCAPASLIRLPPQRGLHGVINSLSEPPATITTLKPYGCFLEDYLFQLTSKCGIGARTCFNHRVFPFSDAVSWANYRSPALTFIGTLYASRTGFCASLVFLDLSLSFVPGVQTKVLSSRYVGTRIQALNFGSLLPDSRISSATFESVQLVAVSSQVNVRFDSLSILASRMEVGIDQKFPFCRNGSYPIFLSPRQSLFLTSTVNSGQVKVHGLARQSHHAILSHRSIPRGLVHTTIAAPSSDTVLTPVGYRASNTFHLIPEGGRVAHVGSDIHIFDKKGNVVEIATPTTSTAAPVESNWL